MTARRHIPIGSDVELDALIDEESGGAGSNSLRILDLGLLDIAALDDGPLTLYTPAAGDFVAITNSIVDYLEHDIDDTNGDMIVGQNVVLNPQDYLLFLPVISDALLVPDNIRGTSLPAQGGSSQVNSLALSFLETADPIVAFNVTGFGAPFPATKPAWQAGHVYAEGDFVTIAGPHWLAAGNAGTSDVSEPAWPGDGDNVQDNDIFWNAVTPTTQGSIHLYAMVATPAPP